MSKPGWAPQPKRDAGIKEKADAAGPAIEQLRREAGDYQARNEQSTQKTTTTTFTTQITNATAQYHGETVKVDVGAGEEIIVALNIDVELEDLAGSGALSATLFTLVRTNGSAATGTTFTTLGRGRVEMYKGTTIENRARAGLQFYAVDTPPKGVQTYRLIAEQSSANIGTRLNSQFWYITKRIAKVGR